MLALICALGVTLACASDPDMIGGTQFEVVWKYPRLPAPERYGNIMISRLTASSSHPQVVFSHWLHRRRYTCRVCHFELNFAMERNTTQDLTEENIRKGEFCGACHNGRIAFANTEETCKRCHTGDIGSTDAKFAELKGLPKARYGDKINWVKALKQGLISPKQSIFSDTFEPVPFDRVLRLDPEWNMVKTRAMFNHQKHTDWLDCADCHPDIFNIQKKGTRHFRMDYINSGKFCGVCHLTVAFPIQDCKRCHPELN